jgi:hypothetical protein
MATIGTIVIPYEWTKLGDLINIDSGAKYCFQNNHENTILLFEGNASPGFDQMGRPLLIGARLNEGWVANYQKSENSDLYVRSLEESVGENPLYAEGLIDVWNNQ